MCPVCREPMVSYELEGVEIDQCVICGGTWLDAGELELITEFAGVEPGELAPALRQSRAGSRTRRRCPRCPRRLREIHAGREEEVTLDRCPSGHGLWFDKGEIEAVVRSYADAQEEAVARFFAELFHSETPSPRTGD